MGLGALGRVSGTRASDRALAGSYCEPVFGLPVVLAWVLFMVGCSLLWQWWRD